MSPVMKHPRGQDADILMYNLENMLDIEELIQNAKDYISELFRNNSGGHDADDHKLFDTENNANTRDFLKRNGISESITEEICEAINAVSFSKNRGRRPETIEGMIVQDADRLDALGAIGIARTFSYGGEHGRSLDESIQHFYDKLLLLKDELNTDTAREIARKRHAFLEAYLEEYKEEMGIRLPEER